MDNEKQQAEHLGSSDCSSWFCGVWETLTNEDATYRQRKSFQYVAGGQNGVQKAGSNPARTIETNDSGNGAAAKQL
jgi:hypothetical protein